jgi:anti-sigma B factor antagonist
LAQYGENVSVLRECLLVPVSIPPATVVPEELLSVTGSPVDGRGRVVVTVRGEVDAYTAPLLEACLDGQMARRKVRAVVVDLAQVTHLGAAGIAVLLRGRRRCLSRGTRLVVRTGAQRRAQLPLELAGLAQLVGPEEEGTRRPAPRGPVGGPRRSTGRS